jgi:hypothetical protein
MKKPTSGKRGKTGTTPDFDAGGYRERLRRVLDDVFGGSRTAFAAAIGRSGSRLSAWIPAYGDSRVEASLPSSEALHAISNASDRSADWLLGFDVPERRTERQTIGDLARELLAHIVRDYERRSSGRPEHVRRRRDGLAHVLGGTLLERERIPRPAKRGDPLPECNIGDVLPKGIITNRSGLGLQILEAEPQQLLARICERIANDANEWEDDNREAERQAVRAEVREIYSDLDGAVEASGRDRETVSRWLLDGALDPLDNRAQAGVKVLGEMWRGMKARKLHNAEEEDRFVSGVLSDMGREATPSTEPENDDEGRAWDEGERKAALALRVQLAGEKSASTK